ncbi:radical SAM protein [bacterium]|nr:radical SAM protein [bacterium]
MTPFSPQLASCTCCPRECGVDRLAGDTGFCGIDARIAVSHRGLHFGEEPPISGSRGSGTIFFAGCNLRCVFCQNFQISQEFDPARVPVLSVDELADEMLRLQACGAHNVNLVSPSHMVFQTADAIAAAREKGLSIPIVYNSNGYDSLDSLRKISGLVDIYMPDLKYMDADAAGRYSGAADYPDIVPNVLREMQAQCGRLELDGDGVAVRGLLVRHLVLPGLLDNSKRCLDLLHSLDPEMYISLMSQYSPRYRAAACPEINRGLFKKEYEVIVDYAEDLGLEHVFVQEMESSGYYLPDFERDEPFEGDKQ